LIFVLDVLYAQIKGGWMKARARVDVPSCPNRGQNGTRPSVPNVVMFNFILLEICQLMMIMMIMMVTIIIII
jgi:hypothetical protein